MKRIKGKILPKCAYQGNSMRTENEITELLKVVSIRGRIAYLICMFVQILESLDYNVEDWKIILDVLCEYTSNEWLDDWLYKMAEYLPKSVLEDTLEDAEFITGEEQTICRRLYQNAEPCVHEMVNLIFEAGTCDMYSRIIGRGENTLLKVQEAMELMNRYGFPIPPVDSFLKYKFEERRGWGERFDSTILVRGKSGDN